MKRSAQIVLLIAAAVSLSACSKAVDIKVANPCEETVTVRVWIDEGFTSVGRLTEVEPEAEGRVPSGKVVEVGSAISDPGDYEYVLLVGTAVVRFDEETLDSNDGVVVLPASQCGLM